MSLPLKNDDFGATRCFTDLTSTDLRARSVRKNDEFRIKTEELRIENKELCIKSEESCIYQMMNFAGVIAFACFGLVAFAINTHRLPFAELSRRHYRMKMYLLLVAILMPLVLGCGLAVMAMMPGTSISVPAVQRFFDMDKLPVDVQRKLGDHLPTVHTNAQFSAEKRWILC